MLCLKVSACGSVNGLSVFPPKARYLCIIRISFWWPAASVCKSLPHFFWHLNAKKPPVPVSDTFKEPLWSLCCDTLRHNHIWAAIPLGNSCFPYCWEKLGHLPPPSPAGLLPCCKVILQNPAFVSQQASSSKQFEDNSHQTYGKHFSFPEFATSKCFANENSWRLKGTITCWLVVKHCTALCGVKDCSRRSEMTRKWFYFIF